MKKLWCLIIICLPIATWVSSEPIPVARFSQGDLSEWQSKVFDGETSYSFEREKDRIVLHADSKAAASGLYREISIDLNKTPILNWTWRINNILSGNDEHTKAGDDYPARVYVVFSGGMLFWRTRAINYVWSNEQPINSSWFSAYTDNAGMIAVESGPKHTGRWMSESRNVLADYRRLFGEEPGTVDAVAIMTDTDNTGTRAKAWYGDIWFSAE